MINHRRDYKVQQNGEYKRQPHHSYELVKTELEDRDFAIFNTDIDDCDDKISILDRF